MSLITVENGLSVLNPEIADRIAQFEKDIKEIKEKEDALRADILKEMQDKGIKSISTDEMTVTFKDAYDREKFDQKQFRADHSDLYDEYVTMSPVKASVTIKLKEDKK